MRITAVETIIIPTGEYLAQVAEINLEEGNFGPQFKWRFDVLEPKEYSSKSLNGWTSTSPSLKGKFFNWANACLGRAIRSGEQLDLDSLVGCRVMLVVTVKENDRGEFNKIESVKAPKTKPAPVQQPIQSEEKYEDPFGEE